MKSPRSIKKVLSSNLFPVVGIGASAGGLEAFKRFLKAIPEKSGLAYVLVQHLDPTHKSILPSLLQKVTKIPVHEIIDDVKVEPDHIYIIPSNKTLIANDGVLELSDRPEKGVGTRYLPIDLFFKSLAEIHGAHAIGVVLSGNGSDGTLGLKAIKEGGGICIAQDSISAANDGMPVSAAAAKVVDHIMPPEDMPAKLLELKSQFIRDDDTKNAGKEIKDSTYEDILSLLLVRKGNDFTHYKDSTIKRRIARRMILHNNAAPDKYLEYLKTEGAEQDALFQDLLIPVTSFFRDVKVFDNLKNSVFPQLLKSKPRDHPLRIWIAGCSTGQEAYSMAMCLKEFFGEKEENVQIFATDISQPAIDKARRGIYTQSEVEGISSQRLQLFFTKEKGKYQIIKELRDKCVFAVHNFLKDPPFGKLDLVSCRNVLIYMSPYLQKKAFTIFHYSLNPHGALLLGKSEAVTSVSHLFTVASKADKYFHRKAAHSEFQHSIHLPVKRAGGNGITPTIQPVDTDFVKTADRILLESYAPVSVIVNETLEVVQFRGNTGMYLEIPSGKPSHYLLKMAKNGLVFELRNLLNKAKKEGSRVVKDNISLSLAGIPHLISLEVIPLLNLAEPHYLVVFIDAGVHAASARKPAGGKAAALLQKDVNEQYILQLEKELAEYREDMRLITAEQEVVNDELQTANEELLSGNEELQSLNEELETSKEELQSTNEELSSLNDEINSARQYAEAIVDTIREPVLVLDQDLRIKTANNAFYNSFRLDKKETEGILIYELGKKQWNIPALRTLLEEIMPKQSNFTDFEVRHYFPGAGERVLLLNALELKQGKEEEKLILLAIQDITNQTERLVEQKALLTRFQNLVMQAPVAMCILKGEDHVVESANDYYLKLLAKGKDFIDKPLSHSLPELEKQGIIDLLDHVWKTGTPYFGCEIKLILTRNGITAPGYFNFIYQPIREMDFRMTGIIVVVAEVTDQVVARKKMESQAKLVKNLMMTAPGFVCTLEGPDHVYGLVNERYQGLFGKRPLKGKPILEALPELKGQDFDLILDKVYNTGEPYLGIDILLKLARDVDLAPEERYFNFSYQPMYDENNIIFSILVFGYEVTEENIAKNKILEIQQKHGTMLEEQVEQRTSELLDANRSLLEKTEELMKTNLELESFNYISSHDLQEPLRKIMTYISLLQQKEVLQLSEKGIEYFNTIHEAAVRMRTLITDLMTYSVTEVNDRKFEPIDLCKLVEEVKKEIEPLLLEKKGAIKVDGLCKISVNASQMRQVFINLISNAIKFSKTGVPPRILIKTIKLDWKALHKEVPPVILTSVAPRNTYYKIQVIDNGIGFNPQYHDQIFKIFQRLHTREQFKGTGIGLAIVKKIVEHHNGMITASSSPGKGATFSIYLPADLKKADPDLNK
jgi:two-component system, chemotaxis family, CheB/CheR fusion protein